MFSNLFLNVFAAASLSVLWGMINALQIVTYLPLFNIKFPANLQLMFQEIFSAINFDIIDVQEFNKDLFKLTNLDTYDKKAFTDNFDLMGLDSLDFIDNL